MPFQGVKAPEEPAGYDPEDKFKDPVLYYRHRNAVVAREFIRVEEAKLIRKKLIHCYKTSGTNYISNCRELAKKYLESVKGVGINRQNEGPDYKATWDASS